MYVGAAYCGYVVISAKAWFYIHRILGRANIGYLEWQIINRSKYIHKIVFLPFQIDGMRLVFRWWRQGDRE